MFGLTIPVHLLASRYALTSRANLPKSFLSIRLRTLGSGLFAIPFCFNHFRTLEAKTPGVGRAASIALVPDEPSGRSDLVGVAYRRRAS